MRKLFRVARRAARCTLQALVIALLFATAAQADPIFESSRALFAGVLRAASFGLTDLERAAFIVRGTDGVLRSEPWPATDGKHAESFRGVMPVGTVAIVHTHPVEWPMPSQHDIEEATRLRIPIYVVTLQNVYRATPDSRWPDVVIRGRSWFKDAMPAHGPAVERVTSLRSHEVAR